MIGRIHQAVPNHSLAAWKSDQGPLSVSLFSSDPFDLFRPRLVARGLSPTPLTPVKSPIGKDPSDPVGQEHGRTGPAGHTMERVKVEDSALGGGGSTEAAHWARKDSTHPGRP